MSNNATTSAEIDIMNKSGFYQKTQKNYFYLNTDPLQKTELLNTTFYLSLSLCFERLQRFYDSCY